MTTGPAAVAGARVRQSSTRKPAANRSITTGAGEGRRRGRRGVASTGYAYWKPGPPGRVSWTQRTRRGWSNCGFDRRTLGDGAEDPPRAEAPTRSEPRRREGSSIPGPPVSMRDTSLYQVPSEMGAGSSDCCASVIRPLDIVAERGAGAEEPERRLDVQKRGAVRALAGRVAAPGPLRRARAEAASTGFCAMYRVDAKTCRRSRRARTSSGVRRRGPRTRATVVAERVPQTHVMHALRQVGSSGVWTSRCTWFPMRQYMRQLHSYKRTACPRSAR